MYVWRGTSWFEHRTCITFAHRFNRCMLLPAFNVPLHKSYPTISNQTTRMARSSCPKTENQLQQNRTPEYFVACAQLYYAFGNNAIKRNRNEWPEHIHTSKDRNLAVDFVQLLKICLWNVFSYSETIDEKFYYTLVLYWIDPKLYGNYTVCVSFMVLQRSHFSCSCTFSLCIFTNAA